VTTATDLIQALLPRRPTPVLDRHTGMPYGWGLWLRALPDRLGRLSRDKSESLVALYMQRTPRPGEGIAPALSPLHALRSLFYQDWAAPLREERGIRWTGTVVSALMHLAFFVLLMMVAIVRLPPAPVSDSEGSRVQVEFIGRGTPEQEGAGAAAPIGEAAPSSAAAPSASETRDAQASAPPPSVTPMVQVPEISPALASEAPPLQAREVPEPTPAAQPLQVTETPVPTQEFVLPPPVARSTEIATPQVQVRPMQVPEREITVAERPQLRADVPVRPVDVPRIEQRTQELRQREVAVPTPVEAPQLRDVQVPPRPLRTPDVRAPEAQLRQAEIAAPSRPATPAASGAGTATARTDASSPSDTSGTGTRSAGTSPTSSDEAARGSQPIASGAGPAATDRSGGWTTPTRGDDRGDSTRNRPGDSGASAGRQPGLFNADGSVRAPGQGAGETAQRGAPGGDNDAWTRERIEQSGTWLQRPPYDHEPTSFDKYWVPNESLLAEWVRKNIRETYIPIPGTNKRLRCVVSLLQLGGGCGITDPNLNEQPASARPPPDIPVKRTPIPTDS